MSKNNEVKTIGDIYNAGVYALRDLSTNKIIYIGSSLEMNDRKSYHLNQCKNNRYNKKSKQAVQDAFNNNLLAFEVLKVSVSSKEVRNANDIQKDALRQALNKLEMFYIDLYNPVCNVHRRVTQVSSNKDNNSTIKRIKANTFSKNPNAKHSEELIANILYLKEQGLKPRQIITLLLEQDIDINKGYISQIGVSKWTGLESKCPKWYIDKIAN